MSSSSSSSNPGHSSKYPAAPSSSSTAEQPPSRSAGASQQNNSQTSQSLSDRIQSSASGLLQSTFNASQRGNGKSLTSELSSGLNGLLGEKGSATSSSHISNPNSATQGSGSSAGSQSLSSSSRQHSLESFRENIGTRANEDAELNSFQQLNNVPEVLPRGNWEEQWAVHHDQTVTDAGKGKSKEVIQETVQPDVDDAFKGLAEAFAAEAMNDNIDAVERLRYHQQQSYMPLNDYELEPEIDLSRIDNDMNSGLEGMAAAMEAQLSEDNLEEAWRKAYRQERDLMDINDRDEGFEPEYDLDKIDSQIDPVAAKEDVLREDDGKDVLELLDDPSQDFTQADDQEDTDVENNEFDFSVGNNDTSHAQASSLSPIAKSKPNQNSLVPGVESLISYAEATSSGPELADWKSLPSVSDWLDLDSRYIDEVWGGALKPYVEAAKEETQERKEKGLDGIGDGPAVRRLGMILNHIGNPSPSTTASTATATASHTEGRPPAAANTVKT